MARLRDRLKSKSSRDLIAILFPIAAALAAGAWAVFTHFNPAAEMRAPSNPPPPSTDSHVSADGGSVAIGGSVSNSSITIGEAAAK